MIDHKRYVSIDSALGGAAGGGGGGSGGESDANPPAQPAAPYLVAGEASVIINFNLPSDGGSAITGGRYRIVGSTDVFPLSDSPSTVAMPVGVAVSIQVAFSNVAGWSDWSSPSNEVTPTPVSTVPATPIAAVLTAYIGGVTVQYTKPADGGQPILEQEVLFSDGFSTSITSSGQFYARPWGVPVTARVRFRNVKGWSNYSPMSNEVTPIRQQTYPGLPPTPTIVGGTNKITVNWGPSEDDGGSPATYSFVPSAPYNDIAPISLTTSPQDIAIAGPKTGFKGRVRATNSIGSTDSNESNEVSITGNATVPSTPPTPALTPVVGGVSVAWGPSASDGGSPITSYQFLFYGAGEPTTGVTLTTNPQVIPHAAGADVRGYVSANNLVGPANSNLSNSVTVTDVPAKAAAPMGLGLTGSIKVIASIPSTSGGLPVTGVQIHDSLTDQTYDIAGSGATIPATAYTSRTLTMRLQNSNGWGEWSNASAAVRPFPITTAVLLNGYNDATGMTYDSTIGATGKSYVASTMQPPTRLKMTGTGIMRTQAELDAGQTDVAGANATLSVSFNVANADANTMGTILSLVSQAAMPRPDVLSTNGDQITLTRSPSPADQVTSGFTTGASGMQHMLGYRAITINAPTQATNSKAAGVGTMSIRIGKNQVSPYSADCTVDATYKNVVARSTIVFTGDDGYATHAALARKLKAAGIPFTMYCPFGTTNAVGTNSGQDNSATGGANNTRISYQALRDLKAELGDFLDIQGNTMNDVAITSGFATDQALADDVIAMRAKANAEGLDGDNIKHYALSNGASSPARLAVLAANGILSTRSVLPPTVSDGNNFQFGFLDQAMLTMSLGFSTTPAAPAAQTTTPSAATFEAIFMAGIANGRHMSLHFHDTGPAVTAIGCLDAVVDAIIAIVKREMDADTVDALTVSRAYEVINGREVVLA